MNCDSFASKIKVRNEYATVQLVSRRLFIKIAKRTKIQRLELNCRINLNFVIPVNIFDYI